MYEELAKNAKTRIPATLGLSQSFESVGNYERALEVIESLLKATPKTGSNSGSGAKWRSRRRLRRIAQGRSQAAALGAHMLSHREADGDADADPDGDGSVPVALHGRSPSFTARRQVP